jgi:hypothetical protein
MFISDVSHTLKYVVALLLSCGRGLTMAQQSVRFARLSCFCAAQDSLVALELENLRRQITALSKLAVELVTKKPKNTILLSPFVGRSLLECVLLGLLIRLDKFRVATISRFASHQDYDPNTRLRHAVSWQGDIFPKDAPTGDLWSPTVKPDLVSRALFSDYTIELFWIRATEALLDYVQSTAVEIDLLEIGSLKPKALFLKFRGQAAQLYSLFSKGVHGETLLMQVSPLDEVTCIDALRQTHELLAQVSLISHFIVDTPDRLPLKHDLTTYIAAKELLNV